MSIYGFFKWILSGILHIFATALLALSTIPIFEWYLPNKLIPGSDFLNTGSYLQKLIVDLKFPAQKWLYHWFSGSPLTFDYQNLHLYAMLPLVKTFGIIQAQNLYALAALIVFVVFTYLLFWEISKDRIASAILAAAVLYSASLYPSLIVIGSITFFATQAFLPLTLYLLEKWRQGKNTKFFYLAALATGFSMYGHPTVGLVFVLPISLFVIYFTQKEERMRKAGLYFLLSMLVGSAASLHYVGTMIGRFLPTSGPRGLFTFVDWSNKEIFWKDFFGINVLLILAALSLSVALLMVRRWWEKTVVKPYIITALYLGLYNILLYLKLNPLSGVLNWPRSLWAFPLVFGAISASGIRSIFDRHYKKLFLYVILLSSFIFLRGTSLEPIKSRAGEGYAYPGIVTQNLTHEELTNLREELAPQWLDTSSKQERLYSLDDRLNMWWSAFFDLPQVRGYFPGLASYQKEFFLNQADISIMKNTMVEELGVSEERAQNAAHFYLDWYAIKYLALTPRFTLSSYLETEDIVKRRERVSSVDYLELQEDLYSPILAPTNSPTLCILGSDNAYNYLMRGLARFNLNSKILIPIKGPVYIESLKKSFLEACDALVLYDFRTRGLIGNPIARRSGWKALGDVIRSGKPTYIETGEATSAGANSLSLPEFFPTSQTRLAPDKKSWEFKIIEDALLEDVDINLFSPPVWEDYPWKLSSSPPDRVREWAKIILENNNNPILVSGMFGEGRVVWSGLNLPFHMDYYDNEEEAKLFLNIINEIVKLPEDGLVAEEIPFTVDWVSPEKRVLTTNGAEGVLLRESLGAGWKLHTNAGEELKIYAAGPNHPGFMYVRLPANFSGDSITFSYSGSPLAWFYYFLTFATVGILLDEILFGGRIISKRIQTRIKIPIRKRPESLKVWWDEE